MISGFLVQGKKIILELVGDVTGVILQRMTNQTPIVGVIGGFL